MSKKKLTKYSSIGLVALIAASSFSSLSNASAISNDSNSSSNPVALERQSDNSFKSADLSEELVNKANPHIKLVNSEYKIIKEEELQTKTTSAEFKQINEVLNKVNSHLKQLQAESKIHHKYSLHTRDNSVIVTLNDGVATLAKEGRRGVEVHWNHVKIYLTKTDVSAILKGGASGGTAALGAAIGALGGLPGAIGGAALGAAAGTIVNEYVRGVPLVVYIPYWKPTENLKVYKQ
ncbi:hypothetical protein [Bacillus haynesii]|uniref:hypothetical protein n=1 Tax=Bacillus haynesii TaxID=1925021 RepID=UPI002281F97B|nr:hypothetical protein [Bacillus haynesii]MCY8008645.1 hypothetical protein [Bacillus haynesii]MCY8045716.1 hypothetical protein [Bacillus haynesii]MCY8080490.1 hypothetical protein [Bacillus haynesii]MCY8384899.1 hypothetical protein [Bacillus haynesii]MCY8590251.1 hypothetical protein [Bacillus haynesii]